MSSANQNPATIAFIGFGEAARAFQESLAEHASSLTFRAYDILLDDAGNSKEMQGEMSRRGVNIVASPADLCRADWVISAVTADQSGEAIKALAPHLTPGRLVIDINSVSPGRKRESAALVEERGSHYLDMAVMAPVYPRKHRTPVLIAGPIAASARPSLDALDFAYGVAGETVGAATAIKMVRSLFVKGLEAITVETLLAAEASGCLETVLASLKRDFPGLGWEKFAAYEFERTLRHGRRRAAEMRESAATVDALGLNGALAAEIAEVQERMGTVGSAGPLLDTELLSETIREVLRRRLEQD